MKEELIAIPFNDRLVKGDHIFYYVEEQDLYIENAVLYVKEGIEQGDHVLFVENERLYPKIVSRLEELFSQEQLQNVHFVNNFTFYWKNGNFHPPTILKYFSELVNPFHEKDLSYRTWGHIEWRDDDEINKEINEYEQAINQLLPQTKAISVCAYDAARLSASLKDLLTQCHGRYMTDKELYTIAQ